MEDFYLSACKTPSDINEHLPTLRALAAECDTVAEFGVRGIVSTWALLAAQPRALYMVDIVPVDVRGVQAVAGRTQVRFLQANSATVALPPVDMLFIDTWHVYAHLKRELAQHAPNVRKYIAMHDTVVDAVDGESLRCGMDVAAQAAASGYPEAEIRKGLQPAIAEFLAAHPAWTQVAHYENNNGLTVLKRI
jgi:hypothetical protein